MKKWRCEKSERIMETPNFKVQQDDVILPNGEKKEWVYWDSRDSALVIGITPEKKLVMIKQYRYLVGHDVIEFASGGLHENEDPEVGARREFEEETGYRCGDLMKLGSFYETYGQLNRRIHIYYSKDVTKHHQNQDFGERGYKNIKVQLFSLEEVVKMAISGKIDAMGSTLAIMLLKEKLGHI